ncbi:head GIN domain-containing protein [Sphingomicrobium nitratireducens]|uniref:head GIN domain-containing protein n=1 Tax=Sphingomicrobium nitratireducens TaxID=2964666 RepID=UPI00223FB787|nr:head GIN domain-containing protein [Sphingomicrobium nitratireducens]
MKRPAIAFLALGLCAPGLAAERNYTVTGFDKVRLEGPVRLVVRTGTPPYAKAKGPTAALDGVIVDVRNRTLVVSLRQGTGREANSAPIEIEVGTHEVERASVNGTGSLLVDGVEGLDFTLSLGGTGSADLTDIDVDNLSVTMVGAGIVRASGEAKKARMILRGMSSLEASALEVGDLTMQVGGPAFVHAYAENSADLVIRGAADVTLGGSPACKIDLEGSGRLTGCAD